MLNAEDMITSGFTLITLEGNQISQDNLDTMCNEMESLLQKYGFEIAIVCENEEAARIQSKLMLDRYWKHLDKACNEDDSNGIAV